MKKNITWILFCSLPFFVFFLQYPLQHSLTGDLDGLGNLAMFKEMKYWLDAQFSKEVYTTICYPIKNAWIFFGADFGIGFIHVLFNYLGINDLWAHYLFISTLFSLNTIALFLLVNALYNDKTISLLASLIFNFCGFTLANLENPNTLVFCFSFISIYYLLKYYKSNKVQTIFLIYSVLIGAISIYFSPYNFLFHCIIISCFVIYYDVRKLLSLPYLASILAYALIISPYIFIFILGFNVANSYNVVHELDAITVLSLSTNDLLHSLKNNTFVKHESLFPSNNWLDKINAAYIGILIYLSAIFAVFKIKTQHKKLFIAIVLIGFIVAFGPYLTFSFNKVCPSLMYPVYKYFRFDYILRIPIRAFFIAIFGLILFLAAVLKFLKDRSPIWVGLLFIGIMIENIPYKMEVYKHEKLLSTDKDFIAEIKELQPTNCLNLPSNLFSYEADKREFFYMYWHSIYRCNILNGNLGFFPEERIYTYEMLKDNQLDNMLQLTKTYDVDCIVFHKDLIFNEEEGNLLQALKEQQDIFDLVFESENKIIFNSIQQQ